MVDETSHCLLSVSQNLKCGAILEYPNLKLSGNDWDGLPFEPRRACSLCSVTSSGVVSGEWRMWTRCTELPSRPFPSSSTASSAIFVKPSTTIGSMALPSHRHRTSKYVAHRLSWALFWTDIGHNAITNARALPPLADLRNIGEGPPVDSACAIAEGAVMLLRHPWSSFVPQELHPSDC